MTLSIQDRLRKKWKTLSSFLYVINLEFFLLSLINLRLCYARACFAKGLNAKHKNDEGIALSNQLKRVTQKCNTKMFLFLLGSRPKPADRNEKNPQRYRPNENERNLPIPNFYLVEDVPNK